MCYVNCWHIAIHTAVLESSLGERQAACAGEEVVFTCGVTGSGRLTWTIKPPQSNSIVFELRDMNVRVGTIKET